MNIKVTESESAETEHRYLIHTGEAGSNLGWKGVIVLKFGDQEGVIIYAPDSCENSMGYSSNDFLFNRSYWKPFYGTIEISP